jgi:preprotein translocase subunit SecG
VGIVTGIINSLLILTSLFLICLILIQRGKGGGLAGAFGGTGGSSAFGTKAGDLFTRVTMGVAGFWIVLSMLLVVLENRGADSAWGSDSSSRVTKEAPKTPGGKSSGTSSGTKGSSTAPASSGTSSSAPTELPPLPPEGGSKTAK